MKNRHPETGVFSAVRTAVRTHRILSVGTVLCVAASIVSSLLPPLLLARVIDSLTAGLPLSFTAALLISAVSRWRGFCPRCRRPCWYFSGRK